MVFSPANSKSCNLQLSLSLEGSGGTQIQQPPSSILWYQGKKQIAGPTAENGSPLGQQIKAATTINNTDLAFCPFYSDAGLNVSFFYSDAGLNIRPAEASITAASPPDKIQWRARGACCPGTSARARPVAALAPWGGLAGCYWSGSHTDKLSSILLKKKIK